MEHQSHTVSAGVTRSSVAVSRHIHFHAVDVTELTVHQGRASAFEGLLSETVDTQHRVASNRRNNQRTTVHRNVLIVQQLNSGTDTSVSDVGSVRRASGVSNTSRTDNTTSIGRVTSVTAASATTQTDQAGVNLTTQSVTSVISVELTQAGQSLSFCDVFDQTAVLEVVVDAHHNFAFSGSNQVNLSRSRLGRSNATSRRWNVNGVTFLTFEVHLLDQVGHDEGLLVSRNNLITPNFWNECCCGGVCDVICT